MNTKGKYGYAFNDWRSYLLHKFSNQAVFNLSQSKSRDNCIEKYTVSMRDGSSDTVIGFQLFADKLTTIELLDIYFVNKKSEVLKDFPPFKRYRFNWQSFKFYERDFSAVDKWLDIPLYKGWKERSTFYKNNLLKTDALLDLNKENGERESPLSRNLIKSYGFLYLFLLPFNVLYRLLITWGSFLFIRKEKVIPPMLSRS